MSLADGPAVLCQGGEITRSGRRYAKLVGSRGPAHSDASIRAEAYDFANERAYDFPRAG